MVDVAEVFPRLFGIFDILDKVELVARQGSDYTNESSLVAYQPGTGVNDGVLIFDLIARYTDSGHDVVFVEAVVLSGLDEGGDGRRHGVRAFNIL